MIIGCIWDGVKWEVEWLLPWTEEGKKWWYTVVPDGLCLRGIGEIHTLSWISGMDGISLHAFLMHWLPVLLHYRCSALLHVAYRIARKFGGLAVCLQTTKLSARNFFMYSSMATLYQTAKFKSHQCVFWGSTAKFISRQYFPLYSNCCYRLSYRVIVN